MEQVRGIDGRNGGHRPNSQTQDGAGPAPDGSLPSAHPLRICLVSSEFLGPFRNGGIGTAYTQLGQVLRDAGHDVTLLYTGGRVSFTEPIEHWVAHYRRQGLRFVPLPEAPVRISPTHNVAVSYRVYLWLRDHDGFDIVHFPEYLGPGYHALTARRQGTILQDAVCIVGLHSSTTWLRQANDHFAEDEKDLEDAFIERRATEMADVVWSPSRYMLDWARGEGWDIAGVTHVQPYVVPTPPPTPPRPHPQAVREIVFFGRQEKRKGILLFLDAIDQLALQDEAEVPGDLVITILGKPIQTQVYNSEEMIRERSDRWPFETRIISDLCQQEAMEYLQEEGRIAVLPSLVENYPNTGLESLVLGVPYLASRVGGIPEQVDPRDVDRVCFEPNVRSLVAALLRVVREGQAPARLAFDPAANTAAWVRWHEELAAGAAARRAEGAGTRVRDARDASSPTVSVCITHHNRPHYLRQALDSIVAQTVAPLEVIVVDDGSPGEDVQRKLDAIVAEYAFERRGWRLVRQENRYLGAARNRAAAEARGEYLLFMDDDNVAKPEELERYTAVARHTRADLLTCFMDFFEGPHAPGLHRVPDTRWVFTGPLVSLTILQNTLGDANALVRRSVFEAVGGFTEDYGVTHEDWEFFERVMLKGYTIEIIPEALFWYRVVPGSMYRSTSVRSNFLRSLRPHLELIPKPYHELIEMVLGRSLAARGLNSPLPTFTPRAAPQPSRPRFRPLPTPSSTPEPTLPTVLPLRYQVVDALNERLKRLRVLHVVVRVSAHRVVIVWRTLRRRARSIGRDPANRVPTPPPANASLGDDLRRHDPHSALPGPTPHASAEADHLGEGPRTRRLARLRLRLHRPDRGRGPDGPASEGVSDID